MSDTNKAGGYDPESDIELERALKWHLIQSEALLRQHKRGGNAGRREVASRLLLWETDGQRALLRQLHSDREEAKADLLARTKESRPQVMGGRADAERMRDMAALNRLRDAMQQLGDDSGVLNTNDHAIRKQLSDKHPQRGELKGCAKTSMPTPAEYGMRRAHRPGDREYIKVEVERMQKKAARLRTERARGPAGDFNEHMRHTDARTRPDRQRRGLSKTTPSLPSSTSTPSSRPGTTGCRPRRGLSRS